ncbi:hypothetical protein [Desulfobaculum bizertense]|uniref:Glycosyl transferase family 8 n=1 Tax=Desulfobaculum bizertense DSM 18034 TaxID=1121442 RepID=A0A1T4WNS4_9BACT|nr:hypothetical protein [Desulfobaculum bizertense]UIJ39305.1 hypothetical protein LWC08_06980 [Desulfobaculum bizertense]SKA79002.1 hypothetical protein SAMN02745702_02473 [Desulfobaculum bizertense DSM 18034]
MSQSEPVFVCCVEAGPLEIGCVRLAGSLRRFGGRFARNPFIAVTPRLGPPLGKKTLAAFEQLDVQYERFRADEEYAWNNFMNKPHAILRAQELSGAEVLTWLDSDVLVLHEPSLLELSETEDLAACAPDKNLGSSGPDDENDAYWQELCALMGIDIEALPFVTTWAEQEKIRLYYNSGVFSFRTSTGFAERYLEDCRTLLDARLASQHAGIFFTDQVMLGLTAYRLGMRMRELPHMYNFAVGSSEPDAWESPLLSDVVCLHYHDAMWPKNWPRLVRSLAKARSDVSGWMAPKGPMVNPQGLMGKICSRLQKHFRERFLHRHMAGCKVV